MKAPIIAEARGLDAFGKSRAFEIGGAIDIFQTLGRGEGGANALCDVRCNVRAAGRHEAKPGRRAVQIDGDGSDPGAEIDADRAVLDLVIDQRARAAGDRGRHKLAHAKMGPANAFDEVLHDGLGRRDDRHLYGKRAGNHADRLAYPSCSLVDRVEYGPGRQHLLLPGSGQLGRTRKHLCMQPAHILGGDRAATDLDAAGQEARGEFRAGDAEDDFADRLARFALGVLDGEPDRTLETFHVGDRAAGEAARLLTAGAEDVHPPWIVRIRTGDKAGGLGATDIKCGNDSRRSAVEAGEALGGKLRHQMFSATSSVAAGAAGSAAASARRR